jgi:hypothetical protein
MSIRIAEDLVLDGVSVRFDESIPVVEEAMLADPELWAVPSAGPLGVIVHGEILPPAAISAPFMGEAEKAPDEAGRVPATEWDVGTGLCVTMSEGPECSSAVSQAGGWWANLAAFDPLDGNTTGCAGSQHAEGSHGRATRPNQQATAGQEQGWTVLGLLDGKPHHLAVDLQDNVGILDGKPLPLPDNGAKLLLIMLEGEGKYVPSREIRAVLRLGQEARIDRDIKRLPRRLGELIERRKGKGGGYRFGIPPLRQIMPD